MRIEYSFTYPDGRRQTFDLRFDARTLDRLVGAPEALPSWTALEFHQCPNCPLTARDHPTCPVAVNLVDLVARCGGRPSYEEVRVEVTTPERRVVQTTTVQRAVSSLLGLLIATSACPHTACFKPMARFHLPLASEDETVYRAASMYLLAQYFLSRQGQPADLNLDGLSTIYRNLQVLNTAMAERLRAASDKDAAVNAVVLLDLLAKALPFSIDDSLAELRHLFMAYWATEHSTV
jgi:hypothetical protein